MQARSSRRVINKEAGRNAQVQIKFGTNHGEMMMLEISRPAAAMISTLLGLKTLQTGMQAAEHCLVYCSWASCVLRYTISNACIFVAAPCADNWLAEAACLTAQGKQASLLQGTYPIQSLLSAGASNLLSALQHSPGERRLHCVQGQTWAPNLMLCRTLP